jgi:hypothetical protein
MDHFADHRGIGEAAGALIGTDLDSLLRRREVLQVF